MTALFWVYYQRCKHSTAAIIKQYNRAAMNACIFINKKKIDDISLKLCIFFAFRWLWHGDNNYVYCAENFAIISITAYCFNNTFNTIGKNGENIKKYKKTCKHIENEINMEINFCILLMIQRSNETE